MKWHNQISQATKNKTNLKDNRHGVEAHTGIKAVLWGKEHLTHGQRIESLFKK